VKIPVAHIEPDLKATEHYPAIQELLDRLLHAGAISRESEPAIFASFVQREQIISTGIGYGLAFPHIISELVSQTVAAFGRSRAGIQFDSLDGSRVRLVFLCIFRSADDVRQILPHGIRKPLQADAFKTLLTCSTADEIAAILNQLFDGEPEA